MKRKKHSFIFKIGYAILFFAAGALAYFAPAFMYQQLQTVQPAAQTVSSTAIASSSLASLAYYAQAEQLDPIFAIEGTDPANLQAALTSFLVEKDQIAQLYPANQKQIIENTLYPIAFLHELPALEAARQALLANPTNASANTYHQLLEQTIGDYAMGARALANNLRNVSSTIPALGYISGDATTSSLAMKIDLVASQALVQKQKEDARFACLQNLNAHCPSIALLEQARSEAIANTPTTLPPPSAEVLKADALSKQIMPLTAQFTSLSKTIYTIPSSCYPGGIAYMREYYGEQIPGEIKRKQDNLNDVYFYNIPQQLGITPKLPILQEYTKGGVQLEYQSMGNLYMCPDSGFDVFNIGRLVGTTEALASSTLAGAQKVLSQSVVQKADLAPLIQTAAHANTPQGDALAERYLQGSADFDQIIMGAYNDNGFLVMWDKKQNPVQFEYLMIARNFASMIFLMGNPTFVPQKISLFDDKATNSLNKLELREYNDDASKQFTDEQIMEQVRTSAQINIGANLRDK